MYCSGNGGWLVSNMPAQPDGGLLSTVRTPQSGSQRRGGAGENDEYKGGAGKFGGTHGHLC